VPFGKEVLLQFLAKLGCLDPRNGVDTAIVIRLPSEDVHADLMF